MLASSNISNRAPESVRPGGSLPDLRKCLAHKVPINNCEACLPGFLRWLGAQCVIGMYVVPFEPFHEQTIYNSTLRTMQAPLLVGRSQPDGSPDSTEAKP
jgi:hypothetical protein